MSDDIAIRVNGLGKKYRIAHETASYKTLGETITRALKAPFRRLTGEAPSRSTEEFWALKDVSFEVKRGEVVGIIGRNGAGKSTLLKILSRITTPTEGTIEVHGRIGSLLEVGTGFHPELSGRENIYLSGSILGMKRSEIDAKFDEIVKFAEMEKFLDTPVKRYSSGMYVRLAFAVAAHLEPEILIIDEVLAVGDAAFQKKCLGKMGEVAKEGRTVLFVSHNMAAINQLCNRAILIENGKVKFDGDAREITEKYLNINNDLKEKVDLQTLKYRKGSQKVKFSHAELRNNQGQICQNFSIGEDIYVKFELESRPDFIEKRVKIAVQMRSSGGIQLCNMVDVDSGFEITNLKSIEAISICLKDVRFYPDTYFISLWAGSVTSIDIFDHVEDCLSFEIIDGGKLTMRNLPRSAGILFLTPEWRRE